MSLGRALTSLAVSALLASCGAPPPPAASAVATPSPSTTSPPPAPSTRSAPRIAITIRPLTEPAHRVHVEVTAEAAAVDLRLWSLDLGAPTTLRELAARDADGDLAVEASARGDGTVVNLARAPRGAVTLRYEVASAKSPTDPLVPLVTLDAMRAAGETLLVLPAALDDASVDIALEIDGSALGASGAASSLGVGAKRERTARGRFLRHAAFITGQLGTAILHAQEADDEAAWIGLTAFDPRAAASETAIVRGVVETFFGAREAGPMPLLIAGHVNPARLFSMSRRSSGMLLNVGMQEPWGAVGRIAVAQQFTQRWIGGAVWVGPDDAQHEAESYWFSEGVARFFARDILFRVGLLEPEEVRDNVTAELAAWYTAPGRAESNAELAAHVGRDGAMSSLVARGSLYALGANARIRKKSGNKRSLDAVMLALLREAREGGHRVLPVASWIAAMKHELGDGEAAIFDEAITKGRTLALPADALGPCFSPSPGSYARFDLGFDEPATKASPGRAIAGLVRGGPAEKAGLRAADVLRVATFEAGAAHVPVKLEIDRDGRPVTLTYLPAGAPVRGHGWARRREVPADRCKP